MSCPILESSLKIGSDMRKRFIWRLDQKCNMFIHEVGQRSSTNITLGAYCISNQIKEQKIYSEFVSSDRRSLHCYVLTKCYEISTNSITLVNWLICKGQTDTGCGVTAGAKEKDYLISSSPVSRIQLLPFSSSQQSTSLLWWVFQEQRMPADDKITESFR